MQKFSISMTRRTRESATVEIEAGTLEEARVIARERYDDAEFDDDFTHDLSEMTVIEDEEPTNATRAARVAAILEQYKAEQGEAGPVEKTDLIGLLTDIRHYCDASGLALHQLERQANLHYRAENPDQEAQTRALFAAKIAEARRIYAAPSDNDLEIDDDPDISEGDNGLWVSAWVWVADQEDVTQEDD